MTTGPNQFTDYIHRMVDRTNPNRERASINVPSLISNPKISTPGNQLRPIPINNIRVAAATSSQKRISFYRKCIPLLLDRIVGELRYNSNQ